MKSFPKLLEGQVALLRADVFTGHVLDEQLIVAVRDEQIVFTIFSNLEQAQAVADLIIKQNPTVECVIYDFKETVLSYKVPERYKKS